MHHGPNFIALGIVVLILFGIDYYVFQGVKVVVSGIKALKFREVVLWSYWIISAAVAGFVVLSFFKASSSDMSNPFVKFGINTFLILFLSKLSFLIILFGEDIYRGAAFAFNKIYQQNREVSFMPDRRKFISQAGLVLAAVNFSSLLYGVVKGKYQFKIHKTTLYFKDLPDSFDGFTITQLSDMHMGSFVNREEVQKGIDLVMGQKSDLFVFTGDMVNNKAEELEPWVGMLSKIKAPFGQFSVLGNHDYGDYVNWESEEAKSDNLKKLISLQEKIGFRMLNNKNVRLEKNGESITLVGIENWGHGFVQKGDLNKALEGVENDDFTVLLSHDPSHWDAEVKNHTNKIHLTLAGHTHGMQMGIETPLFKFSPVQFRYKNWAGLAKELDRYLYVNRGFGYLAYSGRVGIWPEIGVIELKKG